MFRNGEGTCFQNQRPVTPSFVAEPEMFRHRGPERPTADYDEIERPCVGPNLRPIKTGADRGATKGLLEGVANVPSTDVRR